MRRGRLTEAADVLATDVGGDPAAATPDDARALLTMCDLAIHTGDDRRVKALAAIAERAVEDQAQPFGTSPRGSSRGTPRCRTTTPAPAPGWTAWTRSAMPSGCRC